MLQTDIQFANQLSHAAQLRNFKHISQYIWRFSCPYCGDSKKNKTKARGFILKGSSGLFYKCQNCGYSTAFGKFLKDNASSLFRSYLLETLKNKQDYEKLFENDQKVEQIQEKSRLEKLPYAIPLSKLSSDNFALRYVVSRRIPKEFYDNLYYVENFKEFSNRLKPNCFENLNNDHPRLVIPFYDEDGNIFAFQGRALGKEKPKYLTIKIDESAEKIFGIDRLDITQEIYVVEGPIDSMFIDNCVAVAGGAINSKFLLKHKNNVTIIFDNEPRNEQICNQIKKCIDVGFKVCLMPSKYREFGKDINDLILRNIEKKDILNIITNNTYSGIMASVKFSEWRQLK